MTLTQLSYIVAVDRYRHFASAADKVYVTQPTLSMQIHKLEDELGVKIFDRSKSPVIPTEAGIKIIAEAKEMLKQSKHIEDIAAFSDDELRGTFRVGVIPTIAPYLLPLFLRPFTQKYPKVKLIFEESVTDELLSLLDDDSIDAAIIATPTQQGYVFEEELYNEPFIGYLSENHELASKEKLSVDDLDINDLWLLDEGHCFRDQLVQLCKKHNNRHPNKPIQFSGGNLETLKQLVEVNFGMTLLPYLAVKQLNKKCIKAHVRYFKEPLPCRKVRLVYGREYLKQHIISAFIEVIKSVIPEQLTKTEDGILVE